VKKTVFTQFTFTGSLQKSFGPVHCLMYEKFHKIDKKLVWPSFKTQFYLGYYSVLSFNFWVKVKLGKRI